MPWTLFGQCPGEVENYGIMLISPGTLLFLCIVTINIPAMQGLGLPRHVWKLLRRTKAGRNQVSESESKQTNKKQTNQQVALHQDLDMKLNLYRDLNMNFNCNMNTHLLYL